MKKIASVILSILIVFSLCACKDKNNSSSLTKSSKTSSQRTSNYSGGQANASSQNRTDVTVSTGSTGHRDDSDENEQESEQDPNENELNSMKPNTDIQEPITISDERTFPISPNGVLPKKTAVRTLKKAEFDSPLSNVIRMNLPEGWSMKPTTVKSATVYEISNNNCKIGRLCRREISEKCKEKSVLATVKTNEGTIETRKYEYSDGTVSFTYCFNLTTATGVYVYLEFDASAVAESQLQEISSSIRSSFTNHLKFPSYSKTQEINIGIFGNSFVESSQVKEFLELMIKDNGGKATVEKEVRGYATVESYCKDSNWAIEVSNKYDVIFMCGCFGGHDFDAMSSLITECNNTGTKLVVFPANNENRELAGKVIASNPSAFLIDWQGIIQYLIQNKVDNSLLSMDDVNQHTDCLGGFAAATAMYKLIFDSAPNSANINSEVFQKCDSLNIVDHDVLEELLKKVETLSLDF